MYVRPSFPSAKPVDSGSPCLRRWAGLLLAHYGLASLGFLLTTGCAGRGSGPGPEDPSATPEKVWEELEEPRPDPLPAAPRVTVSSVLLLSPPWTAESISASLGIQELVTAELLRRRDVEFVERRRFTAALERERLGPPRPAHAPPVGESPGVDLVLTGSWARSGDSAYVDMRLAEAETGEVVATFRRATPPTPDPTALARTITGGLLDTLGSMNRLPAWDDPRKGAAFSIYRASGIPLAAVQAFWEGVAAEDRYDWDAALKAYLEASEAGGDAFFEPRVALKRTARLRAGGSLSRS
jgi:TolB-like protein